jgi:hypothetical protein
VSMSAAAKKRRERRHWRPCASARSKTTPTPWTSGSVKAPAGAGSSLSSTKEVMAI